MNQYYTPKRKIVGSTQTSLDPCHPIILYDLNDQTENSSWGGQHKWLKINTTESINNKLHKVRLLSPLSNLYQMDSNIDYTFLCRVNIICDILPAKEYPIYTLCS